MSFSIYDASVPVFVNALTDMRAWLDKAAAEKPEADLFQAKLAPDMRPLSAQYQMASDIAKNDVARLCRMEAPSMPDIEISFADLRVRCDKTIAFLNSVASEALAASEDREIVVKLPNGSGYRFTGKAYLTEFALPNFFFHVTTAYAILRAAGIILGKFDFLQHLGPPNISAGA